MLARRRREKIISFTLDKDGTFIWALGPGTTCWPGGTEMLSRGGGTGDEPFKSICRVLGPRAKKPTLGSQHAVAAG